MKKLILFIGFTLHFLSYGFLMFPANFEKRIDNGRGSMEYSLPNTTNETIRYKFVALPGNKARKDMSKWVELYPKILTIKPNQTGKLKLFVDAPKNIPEGEYSVFLSIIPIKVLDKIQDSDEKITSTPIIKIQPTIELVGYAGDLKANLNMVEKKVYKKNGAQYLRLKYENTTPKRGLALEIDIKGKNGLIQTEHLGRITPKGRKLKDIKLTSLNGALPSEFTITEEHDKTFSKTYKL